MAPGFQSVFAGVFTVALATGDVKQYFKVLVVYLQLGHFSAAILRPCFVQRLEFLVAVSKKAHLLRNKQEKLVVPRGHTRMAVAKQG